MALGLILGFTVCIFRSLCVFIINVIFLDLFVKSSFRITMKAEFTPIYVVLGLVVVAASIGTHTAKQQLMHSPTVHVSKKRRESMPEVEDPDRVISSADKFVNKSFLRKVAHIQDNKPTLPDPIRPDPFTRSASYCFVQYSLLFCIYTCIYVRAHDHEFFFFETRSPRNAETLKSAGVDPARH